MIYTITNDNLTVQISSLGAQLISLKTNKENTEYLWQGDDNYWNGQSPILFPIIGGIPENKYQYNKKAYNMNSHGFARKMEFDIVEETKSKLIFKLEYNEETLKSYPFNFILYIDYKLSDNKLSITYRVLNEDSKEMFFSIGGHPAFNVPIYNNEDMEDYFLLFEKAETINRRIKGKSGLLTGESQPFLKDENKYRLSHDMFYNGAIILDDLKSSWVEIKSKNHEAGIRLDFEDFPYFGIWSSANDGPFVCLEPWFGIDSTEGDSLDIMKKEGLVYIKPEQEFSSTFCITVLR